MSDDMAFAANQSKLLRKLQIAMEQFYSSAMFSPFAQKNHAEVLAVSTELSEAFPELASSAREYYFAESEPEPDIDESLEGMRLCLFSTMVSLMAFESAETVSDFHNAYDSFYSDWSDTLSYSEDWDEEHGDWKTDQ